MAALAGAGIRDVLGADTTGSGQMWFIEWPIIPTLLLGAFVFVA